MTPTDVERELQVDVAVQWNTGYDTVTRSFVNVIATPKGGTHVTGFERALRKALNTQLRAARLLKNGDEPASNEDVAEGSPRSSGYGCPSRSSRARPRRCLAPRPRRGSWPTWCPGS